jgi:hypothetical protein
VQAQNIPADALTAVVISLTEEEREYLLQRITNTMKISKSNMTDPHITEAEREHYFNDYQLAVRLLTKLGA